MTDSSEYPYPQELSEEEIDEIVENFEHPDMELCRGCLGRGENGIEDPCLSCGGAGVV